MSVSPPAAPLLELRDLVVRYGSITALQGINISVHSGELVALLGSNGAGKSTTLRAASRLLPLSQGSIRWHGGDLGRVSTERTVKLGLSHCPEGRRVLGRQSVKDNLELGAWLRKDRAGIKADIDRCYALFPRLAERRNQLAGSLSGGEQQMLAIGRALMTNPRLLILDEATEGLAPLVRRRIWEALAKIRTTGLSILIVDKNLHDLLKLADTHVVIQRGRTVWNGSSEALMADAELRATHLGM